MDGFLFERKSLRDNNVKLLATKLNGTERKLMSQNF